MDMRENYIFGIIVIELIDLLHHSGKMHSIIGLFYLLHQKIGMIKIF